MARVARAIAIAAEVGIRLTQTERDMNFDAFAAFVFLPETPFYYIYQ
jgi:hypothetical protein